MVKKISSPLQSLFRHHRHWRFLFLFIVFGALFLTYPGDSYYVHFFSRNPSLFAANETIEKEEKRLVPVVKNSFFVPHISARGAYIIDLDSATPVFEKAAHAEFLPASTTKIITALVAMEQWNLNDELVTKRLFTEGQVVGFVPGEKLILENVLYALLIHSGNDAAYVIADNYPGGEDAFVLAMNKKAQQLSMHSSVFKNPAGLDASGQHTSPFDLSLAGRALLANEELSRIVSIKDITISDTDFQYFHRLTNINKLLGEIRGIGGLKTGYTEEAGENLVTFYKKNGHQFLVVILASEDRFEDTTSIIAWIDTNVEFIEI